MAAVTPADLAQALADWGCDPTPFEPDGKPWSSHTTPGEWHPAGVLHHHTTGPAKILTDRSTITATLRLLRSGRPGLPGPLCHLAPAMVPGEHDARVWLIGWGNCNHAGLGDQRVVDHVRAGDYAGRPGTAEDADGNPTFWGLEYLHPGDATAWPDELLDVGHRAACAIAEAQGWDPKSWPGRMAEHRDFTDRKIDRSWTGDVRTAVADTRDEGKPVTLKAMLDEDVIDNPDWRADSRTNPNVTYRTQMREQWASVHAAEVAAKAAWSDAQKAAAFGKVHADQMNNVIGQLSSLVAVVTDLKTRLDALQSGAVDTGALAAAVADLLTVTPKA
jgi:hypothetical protein